MGDKYLWPGSCWRRSTVGQLLVPSLWSGNSRFASLESVMAEAEPIAPTLCHLLRQVATNSKQNPNDNVRKDHSLVRFALFICLWLIINDFSRYSSPLSACWPNNVTNIRGSGLQTLRTVDLRLYNLRSECHGSAITWPMCLTGISRAEKLARSGEAAFGSANFIFMALEVVIQEPFYFVIRFEK
jgi:hypothetical protein